MSKLEFNNSGAEKKIKSMSKQELNNKGAENFNEVSPRQIKNSGTIKIKNTKYF